MSAGTYSRLRLELALTFHTAFRIGSGREGQSMSDLGVVMTPGGEPYLPGSSLKGKLRVTAERFAPHLGLTACLLDSSLSGVRCCNCQLWASEHQECLKEIRQEKNATKKLERIAAVTCHVCQLFGSTLKAGRLFLSDAAVMDWAGIVEVRDGVVIDRDAETAVPGLKYDFESIPAGASFRCCLDAENLTMADRALLGAAVFEWCDGFTLGSGSSRGLGRAQVTSVKAWTLDLADPGQRTAYLLRRTMQPLDQWKDYFAEAVARQISAVG